MSLTLNIVEQCLRIAGVILGATWAYFKFVRTRTLRPRLALQAVAKLLRSGERVYLHVRFEITNSGLTVIKVAHDYSAAFLVEENGAKGSSTWSAVRTFGVLADHDRIEPGEIVSEEHLLPLDAYPRTALRIDTFVASRRWRWGGPGWKTQVHIVPEGVPNGVTGEREDPASR